MYKRSGSSSPENGDIIIKIDNKNTEIADPTQTPYWTVGADLAPTTICSDTVNLSLPAGTNFKKKKKKKKKKRVLRAEYL